MKICDACMFFCPTEKVCAVQPTLTAENCNDFETDWELQEIVDWWVKEECYRDIVENVV